MDKKELCKDFFDSKVIKERINEELFDLEIKYFSISNNINIDKNKFFDLVDSSELFKDGRYKDFFYKREKYDQVSFFLHLYTFLNPEDDDYYTVNDIIKHLNKTDYTILTNNGYKIVLDEDKKIYVQNYSGDMKLLASSFSSLKEDNFITCEYILDRCEDWQI